MLLSMAGCTLLSVPLLVVRKTTRFPGFMGAFISCLFSSCFGCWPNAAQGQRLGESNAAINQQGKYPVTTCQLANWLQNGTIGRCRVGGRVTSSERDEMTEKFEPNSLVSVGGDFGNVFDHEDYLAMINSPDEASVVLRAHLILEEFLNIWASKVSNTSDLFKGDSFVPFRVKLQIGKNLGLASEYVDVFEKFNSLRNKFSHQRKYKIEKSLISKLCDHVDQITSSPTFSSCKKFEMYTSGFDSSQNKVEAVMSWESADERQQFITVMVVFVLKLVVWMQAVFIERKIPYTLVAWPIK